MKTGGDICRGMLFGEVEERFVRVDVGLDGGMGVRGGFLHGMCFVWPMGRV